MIKSEVLNELWKENKKWSIHDINTSYWPYMELFVNEMGVEPKTDYLNPKPEKKEEEPDGITW